MVSNILIIFAAGIAILAVAILLNYVAIKLGISTWYSFVKDPKSAGVISYIWLFIVYPFLLGLAGYITITLLKG